MSTLKDEPVVAAGGLTGLIAAVAVLVIAFAGTKLNANQVTAILGFAAVLGPVLTGLLARGYVTPVAPSGDKIPAVAPTDPPWPFGNNKPTEPPVPTPPPPATLVLPSGVAEQPGSSGVPIG